MNPGLHQHQIEHGLLRELLRRFLVAELECLACSGGTGGSGRWAAARLRRWIRCLLLIRWTGGVGAGRVEVADGWHGAAGCAWSFRKRTTGYGNPPTQ